MMVKHFRRLFAALILSASLSAAFAQPVSGNSVKTDPPYKISTSGKKITIKSTKPIQNIMLWSADGNRVAEHKQLNASTYTLNLPVSHKTYFLMLGLNNGKVYTEKLAVP